MGHQEELELKEIEESQVQEDLLELADHRGHLVSLGNQDPPASREELDHPAPKVHRVSEVRKEAPDKEVKRGILGYGACQGRLVLRVSLDDQDQVDPREYQEQLVREEVQALQEQQVKEDLLDQ